MLPLAVLLLVAACGKAGAPAPSAGDDPPLTSRSGSVQEPTSAGADPGAPSRGPGIALARLERKITRTAHLELEADDPRQVQSAARSIVEGFGGYVATSDVSRGERGEEDADLALRMVLRVPSEHFAIALDKLKTSAARVAAERVSAEDVTEEFIDVNARLGAQKALEAQFGEILKQAKTVKDAIEVHTQLAEVRSDIDKLEGRMQLLQNQTALSTIHLAVTRRSPVLRASWFGVADTVKRAGSDAASTTAAIVHGGIRFVGFAAPVFALIVMPLVLLTGLVSRRFRFRRRAEGRAE